MFELISRSEVYLTFSTFFIKPELKKKFYLSIKPLFFLLNSNKH